MMAHPKLSRGARAPQPYRVSQNFLTSRRLLERIVSLSSIGKEDFVLEIGTGKGHLTQVLGARCAQVQSIEIDRALYDQSRKKLAALPNVQLICGDFLRAPLPRRERYKVFANIPFSITTQIVRKLTEAQYPPGEIWLVMEKGAAKRFLGRPTETKQSLSLKPYWDGDILYHFRREDFHPMPSVDSVLLHLSRREAPDLSRAEAPLYRAFLERAFAPGHGGARSRRQADAALRRAGLPPLPRDGNALYIQWLCLFRSQQNRSRK